MNAARLLMACSTGIALFLGSLHLLYTFYGNRLHPRDGALIARMREVSPVITPDSSMWNLWIGFNISHSMGPMLFGLVYGYLALAQPQVLAGSPFLLLTGFAMLAGLLATALCYWFWIPATGIAISLACYVAGAVIMAG